MPCGRSMRADEDRASTSYWLAEEAEPLPRSVLAGEPEVEVVGGGVTGCSCAFTLARAGVRMRLHEARGIAGGASGRNGGFALRGGALPYDEARRRLGRDRAAGYWRLTEEALRELASLAGNAFRATGSLQLAADEVERDELRSEHEALREDGFDASWVDELAPPLANMFLAGVEHPGDGALQPARWVRRLARRAAEAGAEIREHSRVGSLGELVGGRIVIATDGYTHGLAPELDDRVRPTRGQVLVTEPLAELLFDRPHYARRGYDYWQQTPDLRLVIGGRRDAALEDEFTADESTTPLVQEPLEAFARELVGDLPAVTHRWAGIWGATVDLLPLAGRLPDRENVWVACGYSGHGNVLGFACGDLVAKAILGRPSAELELFDPARTSA
jgi:gamma-glutamylputrescine oxidase